MPAWLGRRREGVPGARRRFPRSGDFRVPTRRVEAGFHGPWPWPARLEGRLGKKSVERKTRHDLEAKLAQLTAHALAVVQRKAPMLQMAAQRDGTDIGGIALPRERLFSEEGLANGETEKTASKPARAVPDFHQI